MAKKKKKFIIIEIIRVTSFLQFVLFFFIASIRWKQFFENLISKMWNASGRNYSDWIVLSYKSFVNGSMFLVFFFSQS